MNEHQEQQAIPENSVTELSQALGAGLTGQEDKGSPQEPGTGGVESPAPNASRTENGTDPSRPNDQTPKETTVLDSLTLDEIRAHPKLGSELTSWADQRAAAQLRGRTAQIRRDLEPEIRSQIEREMEFTRLKEMETEDLAQELKNPDTAKLYAEMQSQPPPPSQEQVQSAIDNYKTIIRHHVERMKDLPDQVKADLDPMKHLIDPETDPNELINSWAKKVDAALSGTPSPEAAEAARKASEEAAAAANQPKNGGVIVQNGLPKEPVPDILAGTGAQLLADALSRSK